ncbi:hypothetical protein ACQCVP_14715 [Rossellomorea vietnamensis]|uniref:hypothetical protein n=1 Tax=Rossellomorea vietnamensis TaxID=218284 RepID=UPI003CF682DE
MLWKLFFGKSKEEYLQEVLDRLAGMDSQYDDLTAGMENVRELLEASRVNGGLQEEKIDRLLTIMEDWMDTYKENMHQLGAADDQELKRELGEWSNLEKEYQQRIDLLQAQAEEYKQKHEESEKSVWSMQKEVQALKKKMNSMQNKQLHSISKKKSAASKRQAIGGGQEISKEDQSMMNERYDYIPVSQNSKTTIFNPMRYSK